jgi:hypothetical protein
MAHDELPIRNAMPSLANLSGDRLALRMVDALTGDRNRTFPDRALITNLARLVDRGLVRYREAGDYFSEWIATRHQGNESARFRAVSAIEESITLTHRAVLHARRLEDRLVDPKLMPTHADCQTIKNMRDAIQHTEERLLGMRKPPISKGQPIFPSFGESELAIGPQTLPYDTLARVLVALHSALGSPID